VSEPPFQRTPPPPPRPEREKRRESYPLAEAEDAVHEDDGRRRAVEHDGRGAPSLVVPPCHDDVDEPILREGRGGAAQEQRPRRRGRLREVGGHGGAEDVEAEEQVHRRADPELHQVEDEPRHPPVSSSARAAAAANHGLRLPFAIPLLASPVTKRKDGDDDRTINQRGNDQVARWYFGLGFKVIMFFKKLKDKLNNPGFFIFF
jgi:hypothetical protein